MLALFCSCATALQPPLHHRVSGTPQLVGAPLQSTAAARPALLSRASVVLRPRTCSAGVRMFNEPPPEEPDDLFDELVNELTSTQKVLKGWSPMAMSTTSNSLTVLLGLVGWFVSPYGRLSTLIGVTGAGTVGFKAGQKLKQLRRGVVPAAIAELIQESGLRKLDPEEVADLARRYGVESEEFDQQLKKVYGRFLMELVQEEDDVAVSEVSDLAALRRGLGLKWDAAEAAHAQGVTEMLGGETPPGGAATPPSLKKLLWLSMTLFASSKGKATTAALEEALGLSKREAEQVINQLSTPLYKAAVTQAVGKYNRTETPEKLQTVQRALCLSEVASQQVHNAMYDEQLAMLLPDSSETKLTKETMALLGELEGVLQVRSAGARLQTRTVPLYRAAVREALEKVLSNQGESDAKSVSVWGTLAVRQQELQLPTETARASLVEVARGVAAAQLELAAQQQKAARPVEARKAVDALLRYGAFVGDMLEQSGWDEPSPGAARLAQQYLGAISLETAEAEAAAQELGEATLEQLGKSGGGDGGGVAELLRAMLALITPELETAKGEYAELLEQFVAKGGDFDASSMVTRSWQDKLARNADALPVALRQKLALDAYYAWLSDLCEKMERPVLERAAPLRACLQLEAFSVGELYSKTAIDQAVLAACVEQMLAEEKGGEALSAASQQWAIYMEGELGSSPGTANVVMSGKGALDG